MRGGKPGMQWPGWFRSSARHSGWQDMISCSMDLPGLSNLVRARDGARVGVSARARTRAWLRVRDLRA